MSNKHLPDLYPCSGCGACCRRVNKGIKNIGMNNTDKNNLLYFPYKWDESGRCEMLTEDNKCSIYEDRPLVCNVDKLLSLIEIPKEQFYEINVSSCNEMMDEDELPIKYRIKS
jgi:Fe-S-cluster containining protein